MLFGKMGPTQLSRHLHSHSASLKLAYIVSYRSSYISGRFFHLFLLLLIMQDKLKTQAIRRTLECYQPTDIWQVVNPASFFPAPNFCGRNGSPKHRYGPNKFCCVTTKTWNSGLPSLKVGIQNWVLLNQIRDSKICYAYQLVIRLTRLCQFYGFY